MVAKPAPEFRLPSQPQSIGALTEASFMLWLASWRATFFVALAYGLAGVLPLLTLGDLSSRATRWMIAATLEPYQRWMPWPSTPPDETWGDPLLQWIASPQTWVLIAVSVLLSLAAISLLIHRMQCIAEGSADPAWRIALRRMPSGIGAWLVYLGLLLALTLPILALTVAIFAFGEVESFTGLALLLIGYLFGAILLSIPMAWAAVAAGFAPFASMIEGAGPFAAQALSVRRVRGQWLPAGVVISLPMLIYAGAAGTVSTTILLASAGVAYGLDGWAGVLGGRWLPWSQWLSLIPQAALLPLAFAGGVLGWHDLRLRNQARTDP